MRTAAWVGLLCGLLFADTTLRAQAPGDPEAWLHWRAPAGCPDARWVHQRILHVRADQPLDPHPWEVIAHLEEDTAGTWHVHLKVMAPALSERSLEGPSCAEVSEGAALWLALLLEGTSPAEDSDSPDSEPDENGSLSLGAADAPPIGPPPDADGSQTVVFLPPPTQPVPEPAPAEPLSPGDKARGGASVPRGARIQSVEVGLFVVGDVATLPNPTAGVATQVGLEFRRIWLGAGAMYLLPRIAETSALPEARTRIDLWTMQTQVCGSLPVGTKSRGRQGPCMGLEAGRMRAEEVGLFGGDLGSAPWFALTLGVRGGMVLPTHWGLFGFLGLAVPILRPGFSSGLGTDEVLIHRSSPVVLRFSLGFAWRQH